VLRRGQAQGSACRAAQGEAGADLAIQTAAREAGLAEERSGSLRGREAARLEASAAFAPRWKARNSPIRPQGRKRTSSAGEWRTHGRARKLGVQVPADEVCFHPSLPIRVHEVTASVAANASDR